MAATAGDPRMSPRRARVLLVDDRPENLLAVEAVLEPLGVDLVSVRSGEDALRRLLVDEFAVIVLDVQMPVLDGFETARLIKGRERTRHIPIIFLTAISGGLEHHLKGYATGAIDYVYKPFEPEILRAKVAVLVDLWQRGVVIEHQLAELDRAHQALAGQTVELERSNAALEHLAEVAAHDLVDPLHTAAGFLDLLRARHELDGDAGVLAERAAAGIDRARSLVSELLAFARASTDTMEVHDVSVAEAIAEVDGGVVVDSDLPVVRGDRRMIVLLLSELARALGPSTVRASAAPDDGGWRVSLTGESDVFTEADVPRLFTVFAGEKGVGLALCRRIVERHGGAIGCEPGATLWFRLPSAA